MLKLFKKSTINKVSESSKIIEEIHKTFYSQADVLLAKATIMNTLDTDKQHLLDKHKRLKALGFLYTKEMIEARAEINRLNEIQKENKTKKDLVEAINYFSSKYPQYRFITEKSVKEICEKYNLVYGDVKLYLGTVPDKNLKHIENFSISEDDECYYYEAISTGGLSGRITVSNTGYMSNASFAKEANLTKVPRLLSNSDSTFTVVDKCPLEIVAPLKDFDTSGMEIRDHEISKIEIPDPVVLKPVVYRKEKHYLIVTAWGNEASDDLVVNANHN